MPYKCDTCHDTGKISSEDGTTYDDIAKKDGTRPAWVGLLERTKFDACKECSGVTIPQAPEPQKPKAPTQKKRKYTKRSPSWFNKD